MDSQSQQLHNKVNHTIVKCRGLCSQWAKRIGVNYIRMLLFYTVRDYGYCTQKQMCDQYLLPRQTMHNIVSALCREGLLAEDPPAVRAVKRLMFSPAPVQPILPGTLLC